MLGIDSIGVGGLSFSFRQLFRSKTTASREGWRCVPWQTLGAHGSPNGSFQIEQRWVDALAVGPVDPKMELNDICRCFHLFLACRKGPAEP